MGDPPRMNRRERLRAQTLQEIEDASFAIIDADGVHALSIAALARSMAMSAPGIYRYFMSRDALLSHLITGSYRQLAETMRAAVEGGGPAPSARVRVLAAAYRDWALRYPYRYGMLFGQRTAGVPGDVTNRTPLDQAMAQLVDLLLAVPEQAPAGSPADDVDGHGTLDGQLRAWAHVQHRPDIAPAVALAAIVIWTRVHGIVSLELTGMLDHTVEAQRLIDLEVGNAIQSLGTAGR